MVKLPGWEKPMPIDEAIGVMEESANLRIAEARGKAPVRSMVLSVEKDGHLNLNWPTALRVDGVGVGDHVYVWAVRAPAAKGGA